MADYQTKKGDDFEIVNTYTESLVPVDITNYTIKSELRDSEGVLVETFTLTKTSATSGLYSLTLTDAQTGAMAAGTYDFDIEFIDDTGLVFSTNTQTLQIIQDITNA